MISGRGQPVEHFTHSVCDVELAISTGGKWVRKSVNQKEPRGNRCPFVAARYTCEQSEFDSREWQYVPATVTSSIPTIEEVGNARSPNRILLAGDSNLRQVYQTIACRWHSANVLGYIELFPVNEQGEPKVAVYDRTNMSALLPCHGLATSDLQGFHVGTDDRWRPRSPWKKLEEAGIVSCKEYPDYNMAGGLACIVSSNNAQEICFIHARIWWKAKFPLNLMSGATNKKEYSFDRLSEWVSGRTGKEPTSIRPIFHSEVAKKGAFDTLVVNDYLFEGHEKQRALEEKLSVYGFGGKVIIVPKYKKGIRQKLPPNERILNVGISSRLKANAQYTCANNNMTNRMYVKTLRSPLSQIATARMNDAKSCINPVINHTSCRETTLEDGTMGQCEKETHFCVPGPVDVIGEYILAAAVGKAERITSSVLR